MHRAIGIDLRDAFTQRGDFRLAQIIGDRLNLPIHIGFNHMIGVNQGQRAHTAARQSLHRPRANTADADHAHMRPREALGRAVTVQAIHAGEAAGWFSRLAHKI